MQNLIAISFNGVVLGGHIAPPTVKIFYLRLTFSDELIHDQNIFSRAYYIIYYYYEVRTYI